MHCGVKGGTQEVSESRDANNQRIWGTNIEAAETEQRFIRFLRNFSTSEGINIYMQLIEEVIMLVKGSASEMLV